METQELEKDKIKVLQEIADANVLLGQIKADISKLEGDKDDFFKIREQEAIDRLKALFESSKSLITDISANYGLAHQFYETVKNFHAEVKAGRKNLEEVTQDFFNITLAINARIDKDFADIAAAKDQLDKERANLAADKAFIEDQRIEMNNERREIESRQLQIKNALAVLERKENGR